MVDFTGPLGMSTRTWLAGMAMQGLLSFHGRYWQSTCGTQDHLTGLLPDEGARRAIEFADALIAQLERPLP